MTSQGHLLELTILAGKGAGRRVMVQAPGEAILGRSSGTDLQLIDDRVSRRHCQVVIDERGAASVQDLGSGNGTRLDEERIGRGRCPVRDGQVIRIGDNQILVTLRRGDVAAERQRRHQTERIGPQRKPADATPTRRERAVDPFAPRGGPAEARPGPPAEAALDPFAPRQVPPTSGMARLEPAAPDPSDPFAAAPITCSGCQAPTPRAAALERGGRLLCERCAPRVEVSGVQVARQPSAEGDDSTIYQGRELSGGAWVSVEVLRHQELEQDDLGRLRAFAQELGGLEHPGLPRLVRYVDEPGQRALVWSQLAGEPLSERLAHRGPCPWQDALPLLRRVAAACAAAHWAGVPHGDLRAERVLVSERGVQLRWPLPARSVEGGGPLPRPDLPRLGRLPPELVEDVRVRSLPSDVYQFAALCVQVLAGRSLFSGDSVRTVLRAVLDPVRMPELGSLRGLAPQPMIELIRRSVAKEPALRPGSLVEVLATLQLFA